MEQINYKAVYKAIKSLIIYTTNYDRKTHTLTMRNTNDNKFKKRLIKKSARQFSIRMQRNKKMMTISSSKKLAHKLIVDFKEKWMKMKISKLMTKLKIG